jgi:4-diphosphocytidyl-2-C-methyl-D-erythritol kinase
VRAALALQAAAGPAASRLGVHIGLLKNIPSQAGMGGGSSDAASTLLALNRLWNLGFSLEKLVAIGLTLGADVPFFLRGENAWVEGIGEKITPVEVPPARFVVAKPPHGLETARIFSHPELSRNTATAIILGFAANPFQFGRNDLQTVAQQLCPGVGQGLKWLAQLGLQGRMTGSGSAVFAHLAGGAAVWAATDMITSRPEGFVARLCSNLPSHPQAGWASN